MPILVAKTHQQNITKSYGSQKQPSHVKYRLGVLKGNDPITYFWETSCDVKAVKMNHNKYLRDKYLSV